LTKINAENLIETFSKLNDKNFTILRLFNFFGKDMPQQFFIPQMINSLQNKKNFKMTEGKQKRDFLFLDDVIQGLLLSINDKAKNQTLNLCSSQAVSLREIVLECKQKLKSQCKIEFGALPYRENEVWNMVGDNSKIRKLLNFRVEHNLEKAIEKIIN
jgi:UDP-glucose 4-epimerase